MFDLNLRFHHLGLALAEPTKAITFLESQGYTLGDEVFDPLQGVCLRLCSKNESPTIELIYSKEDRNVLGNILKGRDNLIYHTCYSVKDESKYIENLQELGLRVICISKPKPAILFHNRTVSFYSIKGVGIIELLSE